MVCREKIDSTVRDCVRDLHGKCCAHEPIELPRNPYETEKRKEKERRNYPARMKIMILFIAPCIENMQNLGGPLDIP